LELEVAVADEAYQQNSDDHRCPERKRRTAAASRGGEDGVGTLMAIAQRDVEARDRVLGIEPEKASSSSRLCK
jgi:hypothetical protein